MDRVGIRELRLNLSRYVERVKRGESLEVTEYGRAVAVLAPLSTQDDAMRRLERDGRIRVVQPGRGRFADLPRPLPPQPGDRPLGELLDELREEPS